MPRWAKAVSAVAAVVVLAVLAFAVLKPIKVLPRIRLAPGFALVDQRGATFSSESTRGAITLYTFVPLDCGDACAALEATMREVRERVPDEVDLGELEFDLVSISLTADAAPAELTAAATAAGADGEQWRFVGGSRTQLETVVGMGFRHAIDAASFSPHFVVVDGWGMIRGDYRYQTLAGDADKLVRHVGLLVDEINNSSGVSSLAYGAAHVFMCYP